MNKVFIFGQNPLLAQVIASWAQTKDFLTKTADSFQETTSDAMANAIASSTYNWLQTHPVAARLFHALLWAIDRPIISLCLLLVAIAVASSIVKAINRLLELAGLSLLKAPFQLVKLSWQGSITTINRWFVRQNTSDSALVGNSKQQKIGAITTRIKELQQEHNELMQELIALLAAEEVNKRAD
ncbi:hypothetical protein [Aliterella atlantica]|uniref:Uncharacterized protein n=1 Tax=Aliterella atlantica CENA595 TaxID=1618023 RepID=A0A0D8ZTI1_9CYAN|nr:hypothetical protein [Aliterella atlantica]KJH71764.1 hypothetical protein UH38_10225 [Aliterella atlantica CENA595]